eukprot:scaffold174618_cov46-Prasinocladus_malaysianus.AAC.2
MSRHEASMSRASNLWSTWTCPAALRTTCTASAAQAAPECRGAPLHSLQTGILSSWLRHVHRIRQAIAAQEAGGTFAFATGKAARQKEKEMAQQFRQGLKMGATNVVETPGGAALKVSHSHASLPQVVNDYGCCFVIAANCRHAMRTCASYVGRLAATQDREIVSQLQFMEGFASGGIAVLAFVVKSKEHDNVYLWQDSP